MTERRERMGLPDLGVGMGLRVPHYAHILEQRPPVDFFEVISENFMVAGGKPRRNLDRVLEGYRVVQHGVSLGIGGSSPLDWSYLEKLRELVRRTRTPWLSDHLCWSSSGNAHLHDLLPLPYTPAVITRVVERARAVQDFLEVPLLLENTSSYLTYRASELTEWEFISEIAERANIGLLFDVNNVWVSAYNHDFDPVAFVNGVPAERIVQIHLASHTNVGPYIIDTHRGHVIPPVFDLYRLTIERAGSVTTLIEWDDDIPPFPTLAAEAERARHERDRALAARARSDTSVDVTGIRDALREAHDTAAGPSAGWRQGGPRETAADLVDGSAPLAEAET